jgi:hypothetical protein
MNYKIPDAQLYVDPAGPLPTITFDSNLNATHFHVQVLTPTGWEMVLDSSGLSTPCVIRGGPISTPADFSGKKFFWDITLVTQNATDTVSSKLQITIKQGNNTLLTKTDTHNITDQESYYEYLSAN